MIDRGLSLLRKLGNADRDCGIEFLVDLLESEMATLQPVLLRYAIRLCGNQDEAEDLVQETFARALRFEDRFELGTNLIAWLFVICRNLFLSGRRRERWLAPWLDGVTEQLLISPPLQHDRLEFLEVAALLEGLPANHREALIRFAFDGHSYEEVASATGRPVGTIKTWIRRARASLMLALEDRGRLRP